MTQAIVALNSSSKSSVKDEISELNDKKDVALLQEKIYEELSKVECRNEAIQEALIQLDSQLYDITKVILMNKSNWSRAIIPAKIVFLGFQKKDLDFTVFYALKILIF